MSVEMIVLAVVLSFFFGTFIGSFLNVCIHRLPRNESVVTPGSRCYSCGTHVQWYDNLPIVSYLLLRGRCRWCGTTFSPRYLIMEIAVGLLTALGVWWCLSNLHTIFGHISFLTLATEHFYNGLLGQIAFVAAILCLLYYIFVAAVIDIDHRIIPDELTKGFQCLAPILACMVPWGAGIIFRFAGHPTASISFAADQYFAGSVFFYGLVAASVGLFIVCLPIARWVYTSQVPQGQRWQKDDQRAYNWGLWVFVATIVVYTAVVFIMDKNLGPLTKDNQDVDAYKYVLRWSLMDAILGSLMGWALPFLVGIFGSLLFRKSAMGYGDVKFLAPIGAFLGPIGVIEVFFCAALIGTVIGVPCHLLNKQVEVPFGPYLAAGAIVVLLWGSQIAALMLPSVFV